MANPAVRAGRNASAGASDAASNGQTDVRTQGRASNTTGTSPPPPPPPPPSPWRAGAAGDGGDGRRHDEGWQHGHRRADVLVNNRLLHATLNHCHQGRASRLMSARKDGRRHDEGTPRDRGASALRRTAASAAGEGEGEGEGRRHRLRRIRPSRNNSRRNTAPPFRKNDAERDFRLHGHCWK